MYDYEKVKKDHGIQVSQTVNDPITLGDYWDLYDVYGALLVVLAFGLVFYQWSLMVLGLIVVIAVIPSIKQKNNRGIFLHYPYKRFQMTLPGLVNPKGDKVYSD